MAFSSWAQNMEDVVLWRALRDQPSIYWIDVGSENPLHGTVTRAFYDRGHYGVNIDPVPHWAQQARNHRPKDVTYECAIGPVEGFMRMFEVINTGLSTADEGYARRHKAELGHDYREIEVRVRRLDSIIAEQQPQTIHFLKIDVEGAERAVLESIDLTRHRPWIILLEATEPNSQRPTHHQWEDILKANKYRYAYFDGLNRFYIATERFDELEPKLAVPPNVFDDFRKM